MCNTKVKTFMKIAEAISELSTCPRRNVGCVILDKYNRIIATGYNGAPRGFSHCKEINCAGANFKSGCGLDYCEAIHAEQNALLHCADILSIESIFVTTFPCIHCLKLILNTSCKTIYFRDDYPKNEIIENLLKKSEINLKKLFT